MLGRHATRAGRIIHRMKVRKYLEFKIGYVTRMTAEEKTETMDPRVLAVAQEVATLAGAAIDEISRAGRARSSRNCE